MSQPFFRIDNRMEDAKDRYLEKDCPIQERVQILRMVKDIYGEGSMRYLMTERAKLYPQKSFPQITRNVDTNIPVGFNSEGEIDPFNYENN